MFLLPDNHHQGCWEATQPTKTGHKLMTHYAGNRTLKGQLRKLGLKAKNKSGSMIWLCGRYEQSSKIQNALLSKYKNNVSTNFYQDKVFFPPREMLQTSASSFKTAYLSIFFLTILSQPKQFSLFVLFFDWPPCYPSMTRQSSYNFHCSFSSQKSDISKNFDKSNGVNCAG